MKSVYCCEVHVGCTHKYRAEEFCQEPIFHLEESGEHCKLQLNIKSDFGIAPAVRAIADPLLRGGVTPAKVALELERKGFVPSEVPSKSG